MTTLTHVGPRTLRRLADGQSDAPYERFDVRPLSPTIGAEIGGLDLRASLDDEVVAELRRAILEWKVLFFREQHLTPEQHRAFAGLWGELEVHPFLRTGDVPEVVRFEKGVEEQGYENNWHSDVTWREVPSFGSVLRAIEVPEVGGDTMWADMGAAYDGLDDATKERIDGLQAVHDFVQVFGFGMSAEQLAEAREKYPPATHPVVRTIPETGRKVLFVNKPFTSHIVGMDRDESDALITRLTAQAEVPEYQCRFHWTPGSIAWWDNRSTQHYAISDYAPARRVMERATVIGERPV